MNEDWSQENKQIQKLLSKEATFDEAVGKKQRITILHDYHYKHMKKDDIPASTRQMGIGLIIIDAGIIITGLLDLVYSALWWIPLLTGFVIGSVAIYRTQKKYNGSVLG